MKQERRDALLREYAEVSSNFRLLTDIQFKLLGLLPVASVLTAAVGSRPGYEQGVPLGLALFGLTITLGVVTYHARNDQLYNALIARASAIERSLGLPDGAYATRLQAWLHFKIGPWKWRVNHGQGVSTVYSATVVLWLYLTINAALVAVTQTDTTSKAANGPSLVMSDLLGTALVSTVVWSVIRRQLRARERELRKSVRDAVQALQQIDNDLSRAKDNGALLQACAAASNPTNVARLVKFYSDLDPDALSYYLPISTTGLQRSAFLVSLFTDLPPIWIFDVASGRRGSA